MLLSLKNPKHRVITASGAVFYNDFSNTLHAELSDEHIALALNLGACNWTVSERDELAFFMPSDNGIRLVIIDPASRRRLFQSSWPENLEPIDLLLRRDSFFAAVPGMLVSGPRGDDGRLLWTGLRCVDRGAGYLMRLTDGGLLSYTKRGTCGVFTYDPEARRTEESSSPERLWQVLFSRSFLPDFQPPFPGGGFPSMEELCLLFVAQAAEHRVSDVGVRVYALLSYLRGLDAPVPELMDLMLSLDWQLQYGALIDEPFPSLLLLQEIYRCKSAQEIPRAKLMHRKLTRWSRMFESGKDFARLARPVRSEGFSDSYC